MKQDKTTLKPPFDPEPFTVIAVQGSKVTAERDNKTKCRNQAKWKLMKDRPPHLVPNKANRGGGNKSEDEDTDDESYIRVEALANQAKERSHPPLSDTQPEIPSSPTLLAPSPAQPRAASPQPHSPVQSRPPTTPAPQPTGHTAVTGLPAVQGEPFQTGRPKRHPKPVQRYGAAEAEQENTAEENTITDERSKPKGKSLSPKDRKWTLWFLRKFWDAFTNFTFSIL